MTASYQPAPPPYVPPTATPAPPARVRDGRTRELLAVALWALAAVAWVVAMLVPWFRAGLLASVTPMEAAALLRAGTVEAVPGATSYAVLVLPVIAVLLLGLAPVRGGTAVTGRVLLWGTGTIVGLVLVTYLSRLSAGALGWGAGLVISGCVLGGIALLLGTVSTTEDASAPAA